MYERAADWKTLLYASSRSRFVGAALYKARALTESGLTDAALVAYDDAIREGKKTNLKLECLARYNKATF